MKSESKIATPTPTPRTTSVELAANAGTVTGRAIPLSRP
jgi:hypothetical protein